MQKSILSGIIVILLWGCFGLANAQMLPNDEPVTGLQARDIPYDDGGGLEIIWNPLPKEKKIIEYRVYRGVTPDTLFYIGKIPINKETGFVGDTIRYLDQGYNFFVSATSPAKLKHEKGQKKGDKGYEVLYREIPRDMKVYGPLMQHYRMLSVIPNKEYMYKTKKSEFTEIVEKDGEVDTTSYYLAGLKLRQFTYILSKLKVGTPYYYAVQAVNINREVSPLSEIVVGKTTDDPPEKLDEFYAVAYLDAEKMHFEWTLPLFPDDQKQFNIYLYDEHGNQHLIFTRPDAYPYTPQTNAIVPFDSIAANFPAFNPANLSWYRFNIGEQDRGDQETIALDEPIPAEVASSDLIPTPAEYFTVEDNPNDKGDQIRIYYEKPYLGISKISYNNDLTKLTVNYLIKDNELFEVTQINLEINGTTHAEYVLDNLVEFDVDWDYLEPQTITAQFVCKDKGVQLPEDYVISHTFYYDDEMELVRVEKYPESKYTYQVYKRSKNDPLYRFAQPFSFMERQYLDKVPYEEVVYRGIVQYSLEDNLLYVPTYLDVGNWKEYQPYYVETLYLEQLHKLHEELRKEVERLQQELETVSSLEEREQIQEQIAQYVGFINNEDVPPWVREANQQKSDRARMKILEEAHNKAKRTFTYYLRKTDGKGHFVDTKLEDNPYFYPTPDWFDKTKIIVLISFAIFAILVYVMIKAARQGRNLYIRPIAGIQEIDTAIGRATEMGRPILFVPGLSTIQDVATLAGLAILSGVAKKAAEYDTRILVPVRDYIVLPIAQEIVREAHYEAGRPDTYDKNSVFFVSDQQFAFVAGVNGIMIREKTATNFYLGMFWAESLLMTETGSTTGAIQIAGTDAITQLPFFITTCDYTLIGEELYAASAYLSREPLILGTLKAQDYMKLLIIIGIVLGTLLSTLHLTFFMNWFPAQ
ncbi:MAG: DUF6754 domain-containing protein [Candidatus Cloacimonadia bacterium]